MDRRSYLRLIGAGSVVGSSAMAGRVGQEEVTELVAGTAPGFPPFEMKEGGELVGFDVDLLEAVVDEAEGYELSGWEEFEFASLIPALENGQIDVIAAAMTITEERDETIDFSDPYYSADQAVLVREGDDFQPEGFEDIAGRPIGAQTGTTGEGVVEEMIEDDTIEEGDYSGYDNYVLAVQDLENGNIDAVVLDRPVAETFESERAVEVAFTHETGEEYGFGIREGESNIQEALNAGIERVQEGSRYEEIATKWFGEEEDEEGASSIVLAGEADYWFGLAPEAIQGEENPTLTLRTGETYELTWMNIDGAEHDFIIENEDEEELEATDSASEPGETRVVEFEATEEMTEYYCGFHPESMRGDVEIGQGFETPSEEQDADEEVEDDEQDENE